MEKKGFTPNTLQVVALTDYGVCLAECLEAFLDGDNASDMMHIATVGLALLGIPLKQLTPGKNADIEVFTTATATGAQAFKTLKNTIQYALANKIPLSIKGVPVDRNELRQTTDAHKASNKATKQPDGHDKNNLDGADGDTGDKGANTGLSIAEQIVNVLREFENNPKARLAHADALAKIARTVEVASAVKGWVAAQEEKRAFPTVHHAVAA